MKAHRIRSARDLYDPKRRHIFLEVEKDRWLEIESSAGLSHGAIEAFLRAEKEAGLCVVGFTDRNFQWGTIKDWNDSGLVREPAGKG